MLRASQTYFAPDDVSIPCRVRHSETAANREYSEQQDMMCTMRVWHKTSVDPSSPSEFLLSPPSTTMELTKRSSSPPSSNFLSMSSTSSNYNQTGAHHQHQPHTVGGCPELILTPINNHGNSLRRSGHTEQNQSVVVGCCNSAECGGGPIELSTRFASFGSVERSNSRLTTKGDATNNNATEGDNNQKRSIGPVTIPIKDIMLIDVSSSSNNNNDNSQQTKKQQHLINVTTMSAGHFECTMENVNGQLILLTFLKANLPKGKVLDGTANATMANNSNKNGSTKNGRVLLPRSPSNGTLNTAQSKQSFDVEAFTATRMTERLKSDSMTEKVQRRIHRLVSSLEEMSSAFADCGCVACGNKNAPVSPAPTESLGKQRNSSSPLRSTKESEMASPEYTPHSARYPIQSNNSSSPTRFEMGNSGGSSSSNAIINSAKYKKRQELLRATHMPSGLSVESDPDNENSTVAAVATASID